ncbi:hypothetical protein ACGFI9_35875 [Micromonospora sp. NPDC048930]|uniref:hypothetical protein n=1 Tax=Micromonospora sp. NPDC048930 TaxID=3364261 RepID=UPI003717FAF9
MRRQVGFRLQRANVGHVLAAYERLDRGNALGPHGIGLLYVVPAEHQPHGFELKLATRLFLSSPESDDLHRVLVDLVEVATDNVTRAARVGRRWDPLGPENSLVNGGDMTLPSSAVYVGVAVTTLDSEMGPWYRVARQVRDQRLGGGVSMFDLRGQCYALLTDGTALYVDQNRNRPVGDEGIRCTKTLDPDRISYYNRYANLTEQGDDTTRQTWTLLEVLHRVLTAHLTDRRPA